MCLVYIGFKIINNVQDMSVYAVVKAVIFPLNARGREFDPGLLQSFG